MPLTDEQKDIIRESIGKPTLVLAGPGTGKKNYWLRRYCIF